jgi:hypothetical protein
MKNNKNNNNKNKNNNNNNLNNVFAILAIVLVAVSILNFGITFVKLSQYQKAVTGFATAYVNLSVNTNVGLDISPASGINFSNGSITSGYNNATLITSLNATAVTSGNWSTTPGGIMIINSGNVNASLYINGTKNNTDWFGVTTGPSNYSWNLSDVLAGSCNGGNPMKQWINVNHTQIKYCAQFSSLATSNKVVLDVKLQIPSDTTQTNQYMWDTLTITASAAG